MQTYMAWAVPILAVVVSLLVGYLAGYTKKKGENKAIHEDIGKLVDQVRAVTTATKEIEAKISDDVWDRQRRREVKREVLFDAIKRLGGANDALRHLYATYDTAKKDLTLGIDSVWMQTTLESKNQWIAASGKFDEMQLLVDVVCGTEVRDAFDDANMLMLALANGIVTHGSETYEKSRKELVNKMYAVRMALRRELEIDKAM